MSENYHVTELTNLRCMAQLNPCTLRADLLQTACRRLRNTYQALTKRNVGASQNQSGRRGGQKDIRCVGESNPDSPIA